jgi:hypothetical protein
MDLLHLVILKFMEAHIILLLLEACLLHGQPGTPTSDVVLLFSKVRWMQKAVTMMTVM